MEFVTTEDDMLTNLQSVTSTNGAATVFPYALSSKARYRLYSAVVGDQVQLYNAPVSLAGWYITPTQDFQSTGSLNLTIKANSIIPFGYYIIDPCVNQNPGACSSILNPWNPTDPIVIKYESSMYMLSGLEPHNFRYLDVDLTSDLFGKGYGHGYIPTRDNAKSLVEGWENFVFPPHPFPMSNPS